MISDLDIYLFDLRGYLVLEHAIETDHVKEMNAILDELRQLKPGEWHGYVHGHVFQSTKEGINLHRSMKVVNHLSDSSITLPGSNT